MQHQQLGSTHVPTSDTGSSRSADDDRRLRGKPFVFILPPWNHAPGSIVAQRLTPKQRNPARRGFFIRAQTLFDVDIGQFVSVGRWVVRSTLLPILRRLYRWSKRSCVCHFLASAGPSNLSTRPSEDPSTCAAAFSSRWVRIASVFFLTRKTERGDARKKNLEIAFPGDGLRFEVRIFVLQRPLASGLLFLCVFFVSFV